MMVKCEMQDEKKVVDLSSSVVLASGFVDLVSPKEKFEGRSKYDKDLKERVASNYDVESGNKDIVYFTTKSGLWMDWKILRRKKKGERNLSSQQSV